MIGLSIESPFEWLSYKTFQVIGNFFIEPITATYYVYLFNSIIFSVLMIFVVRSANVKFGGTLISLFMFAPLLFFVTLRATPAYMLILCSVLLLEKNKKISFFCLLVAIFYHISALIPTIIIFILTIKPSWTKKKLKYVALSIYVVSMIQIISFIFNLNLMPGWMVEKILLFKYIDKYAGYADTSVNFSLSHYIYLIFVISLFFLMRRYRTHYPSVVYSYIHLMTLVYSIMMISPITAYRISIFFTFPLLLLMPWQQFFGGFKGIIYLFISPFILIFSINGVIVK
jgi:hypothetical protein